MTYERHGRLTKQDLVFKHQDDSVTIIANPVSATKYEWLVGDTGAGAALGTQKNVRILSASVQVTWAVTQPDPLEIIITIDGNVLPAEKTDPVTGNYYEISERSGYANGYLDTHLASKTRAFLYEGRSVKVEARITWATTQPTDLTMRIKWAKIP